MPKGTRVERVYNALKKKGYSQGSAARIAQKITGLSLATGKPPKRKSAKGKVESAKWKVQSGKCKGESGK